LSFGQIVEAVSQIGILPALIVFLFYKYMRFTEKTIERLENRVDRLLDELIKREERG